MGFITNSSSTNFLIISKEKLTEDYLFEKLGFIKGGALEEQGMQLCKSIIEGIDRDGQYYSYETPTYEKIKEVFGDNSAMFYEKNKSYYVNWGCTDSDDVPIVQFFTTDSFEIEDKDFYLNGRSCVW